VEGFVEQEAGGGVGGEVALLLDRVARAFVGDRLGEHGLHHGVDACCDADAGDGVELGGQVPHPFGIHPRPCPYVAALAGEAVHAVVVLQAFAFHIQPAGELLDGARSGDIGQRVGTRDQLGLFGTVELLGGSGDGVDMIRGDRPIIERVRELRSLLQRVGPLGGLGGVVQRLLGGRGDALLGERVDVTQPGDQAGMLGITPGLHLTDRDQPGLDQIGIRCRVRTHRGDVPHPLDHPDELHTDNHKQGVSWGCRGRNLGGPAQRGGRVVASVPTAYTADAARATATWPVEPPRVAGSSANTPNVPAAAGHVGRPLTASTTVAPAAVPSAPA
jgi:hypothetical protein